VGKVFLLTHWLPDALIEAVEIEPEWCRQHPRTTLGDALHLPWPDGAFNAICTSPTYSNRMRDTLIDGYKRLTYTAMLRRKLHPDNSGAMGGQAYKDFHRLAWREARRVLCADGVMVLNCKDYFENFQRVHVTDWHIECLHSLGFRLIQHEKVDVPSMRYGQNNELRMTYESVLLFEKEDPPV